MLDARNCSAFEAGAVDNIARGKAPGLFRDGLTTVVQTALRQRAGVEGGIWQRDVGSLAYGYPTYEGSGPKTDLPQAELPRIRDVNRLALAEEHPTSSRYVAATQTLLISACPLSGPIPELTAWTMTRVVTFAGRAYEQLMAGLAILLATVLAATVLLTRLTLSWSRHVSRIETTLAAHDIAELPTLGATDRASGSASAAAAQRHRAGASAPGEARADSVSAELP